MGQCLGSNAPVNVQVFTDDVQKVLNTLIYEALEELYVGGPKGLIDCNKQEKLTILTSKIQKLLNKNQNKGNIPWFRLFQSIPSQLENYFDLYIEYSDELRLSESCLLAWMLIVRIEFKTNPTNQLRIPLVEIVAHLKEYNRYLLKQNQFFQHEITNFILYYFKTCTIKGRKQKDYSAIVLDVKLLNLISEQTESKWFIQAHAILKRLFKLYSLANRDSKRTKAIIVDQTFLERLRKWEMFQENCDLDGFRSYLGCVRYLTGFFAHQLLQKVNRISVKENPDFCNQERKSLNSGSKDLILSADRLSVWSQSDNQTIQANFQILEESYYYEVILLTPGRMQIGFAESRKSKFFKSTGNESSNSISYSGFESPVIRYENSVVQLDGALHKWDAGKVVGCGMDRNSGKVKFYLDGKLIYEKIMKKEFFKDNNKTPALTLWKDQLVYCSFQQPFRFKVT